MPLGIDNLIVASDIMEVKDLKEGKIFLLKGRDGSSVVLKSEPKVTGDQIKMANPVVKAIDPSCKMKPLTLMEVHELRIFVRQWEEYVNFVEGATGGLGGFAKKNPIQAKEKAAISNLVLALKTYGGITGNSARSNMAKMSLARMSTLGVVLDVENANFSEESWTEARGIFGKFVKALNGSGGLEKLGKIVAGDFFIGNEDRFISHVGVKKSGAKTSGGMQVTIHGEKKRLLVIRNLGNVIIVEDSKGKVMPSMLDYMDPSQVTLTPVLPNGGVPDDWPMRNLLIKPSRRMFADSLVEDLEYLLKPEKGGSKKLGGARAASRLDDGIVSGIKAIVKSLGPKRAGLNPTMQAYYDLVRAAKL